MAPNIDGVPLVDIKGPLVGPGRCQDFPEGLGVDFTLQTGAEVRKVLCDSKPRLRDLTQRIGVVRLRSIEPFHMRNAISGKIGRWYPARSLPWHVDVEFDQDAEVDSSLYLEAALHPELWASGVGVIWQNSCELGRPARFLLAPTKELATSALQLYDTPFEELVDKKVFQPKDEIYYRLVLNALREHIREGEGSLTAAVMALRDYILDLSEYCARDKVPHLNVAHRINDELTRRVDEYTVSTDFTSPENRNGVVLLFDEGVERASEKSLVHTRWNVGGRALLKRDTPVRRGVL